MDKNLEKCILKENKWIVCKKKKKKRKKITNKNKRKKSGDNQRKKPCEGKKSKINVNCEGKWHEKYQT